MNDEEHDHINRLLHEAAEKDRGYASFSNWPDRDVKEVGWVSELFRSLQHVEHKSYSRLRSRGQGNDPPDCEAIDSEGRTIGIEVTELVDQSAVEKCNSERIYKSAEWGGGY
jgi:hypothetical protein